MWPFNRPIVTEVKVVEIRPGDRLVVECPDRVPEDYALEVRRYLAEFFGIDEARILVISNATVKVLREGDPPPPPVILSLGQA
jgi:hypothetical protein